eukprot:GFYU01007091.1.p1 GENE.GFYU01007091.1~~GFYU01007091.1.p1  ORF type:complete len:421 (-),score=94.48 GFYU01007091.1:135-1397(-)
MGSATDFEKGGGVFLECLGIMYLFGGMAILCDSWFIHALEIISRRLNISDDVAGAAFMALSGSSPELFLNIVSCALGDSNEYGLSTIVGSSVFNFGIVIGSAACICPGSVAVDPAPLFRDATMYLITTGILGFVLLDAAVTIWEAAAMVILYFLYLILLVYFWPLLYYFYPDYKYVPNPIPHTVPPHLLTNSVKEVANIESQMADGEGEGEGDPLVIKTPVKEEKPPTYLDKTITAVFYPWKLLFSYTVPNCEIGGGREHWYLVTLIVCIIYIALGSSAILWLTDRVVDVMGIARDLFGMTLIAFGASVSDFIFTLIAAKKGRGDMALGNAVGSNIFDVLVGLGLPWLVVIVASGPMKIHSSNVVHAMFFIWGFLVLYVVGFLLNRMKFDAKIGSVLLFGYFGFLVHQTVMAMNQGGAFN